MPHFLLSTHDISNKFDPHWSEVQYYINILRSTEGSFLTLAAQPHIANILYIQAMWHTPKPKRSLLGKKRAAAAPHFIMEALTNEPGNSLHQNIYTSTMQAEVETIFADFFIHQKTLDLSRWDIEVFCGIEPQKCGLTLQAL